MSILEIASVSSKGQMVIPGTIRTSLGIKSGTKMAVITDGQNVLMKPLDTPKLAVFDSLIAESRAYARRSDMKPSDVSKTIRKVRDAHRSGR